MVEGAGPENRWTRKGPVGSNPTPTVPPAAKETIPMVQEVFNEHFAPAVYPADRLVWALRVLATIRPVRPAAP